MYPPGQPWELVVVAVAVADVSWLLLPVLLLCAMPVDVLEPPIGPADDVTEMAVVVSVRVDEYPCPDD